MLEANGFQSKRVDKELGPGGDLGKPENRRLYLRDARQRRVVDSCLGPPCTTLSMMQGLTPHHPESPVPERCAKSFAL